MKSKTSKILASALLLPFVIAVSAFADDAPSSPTPTPAAPAIVPSTSPTASPVPTMPGGGGGGGK